jgi:hypothetical protein
VISVRSGDKHEQESKPHGPLPPTPQGKKKFMFSKEASRSFAVEQISEHTNRIASRKLMFSQKTSGVVVTTWFEFLDPLVFDLDFLSS